MIGLTEIINILIIITIVIIIFKILQVIGSLVTNYSAAENVLSKPVWAFISRLLTYALIIILVAITIIWVFWRLLKLFSPAILGLGDLIIKIVPPFPQLTESGIFQLWDDIFASIIQLSPTGIVRAFLNFFNNSGKYVLSSVVPESKSNTKVVSSKKPNDKKEDKKKDKKKKDNKSEYVVVDNSGNEEMSDETPEDAEETKPDATEESKYTATEHKAVQTKMDMCIAENSIPTDSAADPIEKLKANVNNNKVSLMCQAQSLGQYNTISKYK